MNLRRVVLVSALASVIPFFASPARASGPAPTWCAIGDPKSVLACLSAAYQARDIAAYEKLLAPDFRFSMADGKVSWDREKDIRGTRLSIFESKEVSLVELTFTGEVKAGPGPKPDTWTLDDVDATLHIVTPPGIKPGEVTMTAKMKFVVQLLNDPEPHYAILEWEELGSAEN